jgi:hypothetical protein
MKRTRDDLLEKVSELSKKRDAYLESAHRAKAARDPRGEDSGFDEAAKGALRKTVADNPLSGLKL